MNPAARNTTRSAVQHLLRMLKIGLDRCIVRVVQRLSNRACKADIVMTV